MLLLTQGSEINLGISQGGVKIPLRKIYLPYITTLVPDYQLKYRLISINPICFANRICCQPLDYLIWSLENSEMNTSAVHGTLTNGMTSS